MLETLYWVKKEKMILQFKQIINIIFSWLLQKYDHYKFECRARRSSMRNF